jgi:hypothetical protein
VEDYTGEILAPMFEELKNTYNPNRHHSIKLLYRVHGDGPGGLLFVTHGALVPAFLEVFLNISRETFIGQLHKYNPENVTITHTMWETRETPGDQ